MRNNEQLWGCGWCLGVLSFFAITYTVWKGIEITDSPFIVILPCWGFWIFCLVFDYVLPKLINDNANKWIQRAGIAGAFIFCFFVFFTCEKGIKDNTTVYFNEYGEYYHDKKDCDEIDTEQIILQSRRIEADKNGLKPCYCCDNEPEDLE